MKIRLLAVGKLRATGLQGAAADYAKRIGRYTSLEVIELKDGPPDGVATTMRRQTPARSTTLAMEVKGTSWSSQQLAHFVDRQRQNACAYLVIYVGGAYGLPPALSAACDMRLSLSAMTLPHRLARVVLLEQLYRAYTILEGEPYSH